MYRLLMIVLLTQMLFAKERIKLLIPLYSEPSYWTAQLKTLKTIQKKDIETYAIINAKNGPGKNISEAYVKGIALLKEHNIKVLGYVYTQYGKRNIYDIKADIYTWSDFYQSLGVEGIFFDETALDKKYLPFYEKLSTYSKSLDFDFIVLNAGYTTHESFIKANIANVIVTYENSFKNYNEKFPATTNQESKQTKLSVLLYGLETKDFKATLKKVQKQGFSYIYLTEDRLPNPWDELSNELIEAF